MVFEIIIIGSSPIGVVQKHDSKALMVKHRAFNTENSDRYRVGLLLKKELYYELDNRGGSTAEFE